MGALWWIADKKRYRDDCLGTPKTLDGFSICYVTLVFVIVLEDGDGLLGGLP